MPTALVTGATAGIGLEFARQLAERGTDIVLVARDRQRLDGVAADLHRRFGVTTEVLVADLADRAAVQVVADRLADGARPVDLLVNNAGFGLKRGFLQNEVEVEEGAFDVLCRAVLVLSHAAARAMKVRGHGSIINVSSVASFVAMGSYSAAKAWVTVFSEGLANELAGSGVRVMALCPGFTHTEFHQRAEMNMSKLPDALWLDADELVRDALADLDRGRVVSVPGAAYKVLVGALAVVPRGLARSVSGGIAARRRPRR
jgi:short-subunit dehydrogenase